MKPHNASPTTEVGGLKSIPLKQLDKLNTSNTYRKSLYKKIVRRSNRGIKKNASIGPPKFNLKPTRNTLSVPQVATIPPTPSPPANELLENDSRFAKDLHRPAETTGSLSSFKGFYLGATEEDAQNLFNQETDNAVNSCKELGRCDISVMYDTRCPSSTVFPVSEVRTSIGTNALDIFTPRLSDQRKQPIVNILESSVAHSERHLGRSRAVSTRSKTGTEGLSNFIGRKSTSGKLDSY